MEGETKIFFDELSPVVKQPCVGLLFRYTENNYYTNGKIVFTQQLSLLKKQSCKGCQHCSFILDDVSEFLSYDDTKILNFDTQNLINGDTVKLVLVEDSRDWETGICERWHYNVIKV